MYVAANFHYLQGLRLDAFNARPSIETDSFGLVLPNPPTTPFGLDWHTSSSGRGMASMSASRSSSIAGISVLVWAASRTG